jgi:GDP-L-fucose synthase
MINRFVSAARDQSPKVVCWGTGSPTREFIFVEDAVQGILAAAVHYESTAPLNIGPGIEVSIKELTQVVAPRAGYTGEIEWDTSKPDGRARVCLDNSRMCDELPHWRLRTLEEGMEQTVRWFMESHHLPITHS